MGGITEIATAAPGYNSIRPNTCAPLAEVLKPNGYATAQFGKCHEVPVWETSPMGPFHNWPTGSGFEYFYGFIGGEAHQYYPAIYEGTIPVEPQKTPEAGYHFMADMTDKAIERAIDRADSPANSRTIISRFARGPNRHLPSVMSGPPSEPSVVATESLRRRPDVPLPVHRVRGQCS